MSEPENFDVFLCHNSKDKADVRIIAQTLEAQGIITGLDEGNFIGGDEWRRKLYNALNRTKIAFVFLGKYG